MQQPDRSDSDDIDLIKQVTDTHLPDGTYVDVKPLIYIVGEILGYASAVDDDFTSSVSHTDVRKSYKTNSVLILDSHSHIIDKLATEMSLSGRDGHATALSLFHTVGNFEWEAKLALILAAFALEYGDLWLLAQVYSSNQLAQSMAILRQAPMIMEHSAAPSFDALNELVHLVLESFGCIMQLKELPPVFFGLGLPEVERALNALPTVVYWNVRGIIACAAQITNMEHEYEISSSEMIESWDISTLILQIKKHHHCGERKETYILQLFNQLLEAAQTDNMKILKILLNSKDDPKPLFDGNEEERVSLDVLRRRNVLLLISGLDISHDELFILRSLYPMFHDQGYMSRSRRDGLYEIVWVPIVDPSMEYTDAMHIQFEDMRNNMPWYSVYHPSNIDRAVKKLIGNRWHFRRKPILVVLDRQGRELSPNAMHMMWIWGGDALPFTTAREEDLWRDETWNLELLVDSIDQNILDWVSDGKYIFLYGGDDIEWIRRFTINARAMANAARIPLEVAYVGKSKNMENVKRAMCTIRLEMLSHSWGKRMVWHFWTRLEHMLFSVSQIEETDVEGLIPLQVKKLLGYDADGSWALLSRGSEILTLGHGSTMLRTLAEFDLWKEHIPTRGFGVSFKEYHDHKLHVPA